jgi:hypothetical protein
MATVSRREETPVRIQNIVEQLGRGLCGALMKIGGAMIAYHDTIPTIPTSSDDAGWISAQCYLTFSCNGKRGQGWRFHVALEPNDTYTVRLWRSKRSRGAGGSARGEIIGHADHVYCDALREVVVRLYDDAIRQHCDGFIPD